MVRDIALVASAAFLLTLVATGYVRRMALAKGILDHPNSRSSHSLPTPRSGGLAILVVSAIGICALAALQIIDRNLALASLGGGLPIAWIGFMDDRGKVSVRVRFGIHIVASIWAVYILGGLPPIQVGNQQYELGIVGDMLGVVAIVWTLNLFNFMDGIDGIAASEALFIAAAGAFIGVAPGNATVFGTAIVLAAASLGFLVWNWPAAKIFMGDIGSGYLGYVIAVVALAAARDNPVALYIWLILGAVFFVDATVTLLRRLWRRERVYVAHRSHAYQWLARRWASHLSVTLLVWLINIGWLLPMAWLCVVYPARAIYFVMLALLPLVPLALAAGAGRAE